MRNMTTLKYRASMAAVGALISGSVVAETELDAVDIWATEVQASSINLDDETIATKQADHVSDLLRPIPGVDVGGAHSLNQRITIRSMDDKDLRINIDGANQNTYMYHHMGNLQIHADILERVDVGVGTNSVLDGGLGGSVEFKTKSAKQLLQKGKRFGGRIQGTYGDNSGEGLAVTGFGQLSQNVDILAYFNQFNRSNFDVGGGKIKDFAGKPIPDTDGKVRGLKGKLSDALIKFGWNITNKQRFEVGYENYRDKGNYSYRPDMGLATDLAITNNLKVPLLWPTEFTRDTLTLNYSATLSGNTALRATAFRNVSELDRDEQGWAVNPRFAQWAGRIDGKATNSGLKVRGDTLLGRHKLDYGVEMIDYKTHYKASYVAGKVDESKEKATDLALYVQDEIELSDKFSLIPGVRYNNFDIDSKVVKKEYSEFTGALAAEFEPNDSLSFRLSSTQLFKGPEIGEVFVGAGLTDVPNKDIKAETGTNTELSVAYENSVLGADRFSVGATVFRTKLNNYIYDYAPPPANVKARSWKDNVGDMNIDGVEAYIGYDKGNLTSLLTFSKADSELDAFSQYASLDGARLDRKQGDTISLDVGYALPHKNLTLNWGVLSVGKVAKGLDLDGASVNNKKDGFTVHNISARWKPQSVKGLSVTFGVDNVFDEYYASQSSRTGLSVHPRFGDLYLQDYEPGRNIKITAAYNF